MTRTNEVLYKKILRIIEDNAGTSLTALEVRIHLFKRGLTTKLVALRTIEKLLWHAARNARVVITPRKDAVPAFAALVVKRLD